MIKLSKYLRPFLFGIILSIVLLFGQAMGDLKLPNYMSQIVDVGIGQSGIEHAAPEAISVDGMKLITTFMNESEESLVKESYSLLSSTEKNNKGKTYKDTYPNVSEELYVRKDIDNTKLAELDNAFGTATWTFIEVMKAISPQVSENQGKSEMKDIDLNQIYLMQPNLDNLPKEILNTAHDNAVANNPFLLKQSGIMFAKAFYTDLGADTGKMQNTYIFKIGLLMLLVAMAIGLATVLVSLLSSRIATGVARDIRKAVFSKIESFSNNEFDKFSTASLITRCTNDITQIQQLVMMGIRMMFYAPIIGIGGVIMAVEKSASMSWILAITVIVTIGILMIIMSIAMPRFKRIQKLIDRLNLVSRENLSGLMVIRAFGTQDHEEDRFKDANKSLTNTNLFVSRLMSVMMPIMGIIMNGLILVIIWSGAHQIANSALQIGDMMAFIQYSMQVLMAFMMISMMFIMVPRAAVSAVRIAEVLDTELVINDLETTKEFLPNKKGVVEFKNVFFRYHNAEEDALSDITFTAMPGKTTAIIGSTGSGKSTIANLALRLYDVTEGQVLVDGVDVREVSQKDLREKIGYVPQKGVLLSGTIGFNLRYGKKDATDEEIEKVAEIAQAKGFINEREEKYESLISQGSTNVSGGQKQRLSIARALAKKPEILIFDDSFSALDLKTDSDLRKAIKENTGDTTVIVVAQRVSTIINAEQIIVLDNGKIVGHGTHKELLECCTEYFEIVSSQMTKEELA